MPREIRSSLARATLAVAAVALGCASLACGSLLGIDSGSPLGDGSAVDRDSDLTVDASQDAYSKADAAEDGRSVTDASLPMDGSPDSDAISASDGGFFADSEAGCTPDLSWCNTHCGDGLDNCQQMRSCPPTCTKGESCIANACTCHSDPNWCTGRCLDVKDNCGVGVTCPACPNAGTCYNGVCGCMAESASTTCGTRQCGQATNNCNLAVNCGVGGTTACPSGQVCLANTSQCCTPDNAAACGTQCQVTVTNNCGQQLACPKSCPNNGVCVSGNCCTPTGCGGNCIDNCGQQNSQCCSCTPTGCGGNCLDNCGKPNSSCCAAEGGVPPSDSGPPVEGGPSCLPPTASCNDTVPCCSGACSYSGTCVPMCGKSGGPCNSNTQCCYGLLCQSGPLPAAQAGVGGSSSGGPIIMPVGQCF